jgi:hypothetical protein
MIYRWGNLGIIVLELLEATFDEVNQAGNQCRTRTETE